MIEKEIPRTTPSSGSIAPQTGPGSVPSTPSRGPSRSPRAPQPGAPSPKSRVQLDRLFLYRRGDVGWDQIVGFRGGPVRNRQGRKLVLWSWMASSIDALVLISASCLFLMTFSWIVHTSPVAAVRALAGTGFWVGFGALFASCAWVYLLTLRCFFGFTIGEWACDLRLGQPHQRFMKSYPVKVLLRVSLIVGTGLFVLPLFSFLTGRDWAGKITGLFLISLR